MGQDSSSPPDSPETAKNKEDLEKNRSESLTTLESIDASSSVEIDTSANDSELKRFSCDVEDFHNEYQINKTSRQFEVVKEVVVTEMKRTGHGF